MFWLSFSIISSYFSRIFDKCDPTRKPQVVPLELNLASLASVRSFAERWTSSRSRFHQLETQKTLSSYRLPIKMEELTLKSLKIWEDLKMSFHQAVFYWISENLRWTGTISDQLHIFSHQQTNFVTWDSFPPTKNMVFVVFFHHPVVFPMFFCRRPVDILACNAGLALGQDQTEPQFTEDGQGLQWWIKRWGKRWEKWGKWWNSWCWTMG